MIPCEVRKTMNEFLQKNGKSIGRVRLENIHSEFKEADIRRFVREYNSQLSGFRNKKEKNVEDNAFFVLKNKAKVLIKKAIKNPIKLITLSEETGLSIYILRELVKDVSEETGLPILCEGENIIAEKVDFNKPTGYTSIGSLSNRKVKIGIVSDTHFGSIWQQVTALHQAYDYFEKEKVDFCVHAGVNVFQLQCFQAKSDYLASKCLTPFVGAMIVTFTLDSVGRVIKIIPEIIDLNSQVRMNDF